MEEKKQIRVEYRRRRDRLPEEQIRAWAGAINAHLVTWSRFLEAGSICFYYPLGNEVDLLSSANLALSMGKEVYFPRTEGSRMEFYRVTDLEHFQEGAFHVMEPEGSLRLTPEEWRKEPFFQSGRCRREDGISRTGVLILAPGVAFDRQKQRLGYGKGYYDRYLTEISGAVTAGIAYGCQIAEKLPAEERDIPMDYMITEAGIW